MHPNLAGAQHAGISNFEISSFRRLLMRGTKLSSLIIAIICLVSLSVLAHSTTGTTNARHKYEKEKLFVPYLR
jgi:hypothetical protein